MRTICILIVAAMLFTACPHATIKIYEGPAEGPPEGKKPDPIWTIVNPPDELVFEREKGQGESKEIIKIVVKKEKTNLNPFSFIPKMFSDVVALLFGTLGGVQPAVGQ